MKKLLCKDEVTGRIYFKDVDVWNDPVLGPGMYPVNWNGSDWERTTVEKWDYNYESVAETKSNGTVAGNGKGKWANSMTEDGSIYVWIPRYTYKIVSGYHKAVKSWNSDLVNGTEEELGKIEVKFSDAIKDDTSDGFILHPAFTFGEDELTGFWVMKFTASRSDATDEDEGLRNIVSSRPNVVTWRNITIGKAFSYSYKLNRELDSHLIKNIEWGAVAYLTNAIGRIPYINNCSKHITGMSGETQDADWIKNWGYIWNTEEGVKASTTHNVYGVYDMSGGTLEYVAAYYGEPYINNAVSLINASKKYKDVYKYRYSDKVYGDGIFETSNGTDLLEYAWDEDFARVPSSDCPIFVRSGHYAEKYFTGIFCCKYGNGYNLVGHGFRAVLAIKKN